MIKLVLVLTFCLHFIMWKERLEGDEWKMKVLYKIHIKMILPIIDLLIFMDIWYQFSSSPFSATTILHTPTVTIFPLLFISILMPPFLYHQPSPYLSLNPILSSMAFSKTLSLSLCIFFPCFLSLSQAYTFYVGGKDGWVLNPSESYDIWANRNKFRVNDVLGKFYFFLSIASKQVFRSIF